MSTLTQARSHLRVAAGVIAVPGLLGPSLASACACGCGVFDVGTASMFPQHSGATANLEFDAMDQDRNWSGTSSAPAADNPDKEIRTYSTTAGLHYQLDRSWGLAVAVPYHDRTLRTVEAEASAPVDYRHTALGDLRITASTLGSRAICRRVSSSP